MSEPNKLVGNDSDTDSGTDEAKVRACSLGDISKICTQTLR